jgi:hypothetical protein
MAAVTRSVVSKTLKIISSTHQLSSDASDRLETLINGVFLPKLLDISLKIAHNRSGGKRKILREDVEIALFALLPFTLFTGADNQGKHAKIHIVSGGVIKNFALSHLENDRQYQKLPTESVIYIRGIIDYSIKYIIQQAVTRGRIENVGGKRLTAEHINAAIAKDAYLVHVFPDIAVEYFNAPIAPK